MKTAGLCYEEFIELAQANYTKGGSDYVECWEKYQYEEYVKEFGPVTKTKAKKMFKESLSENKEEIAIMEEAW